MKKFLTCWIVTEGLVGTENQCIGVARALGVRPVIKRINLRQPWKALSPLIGFENALIFTGDPLAPDRDENGAGLWPDLLLCAGRKSIAAARYIKRKSGGKTFTVHLQDPRIHPKNFDLVAVPFHDRTRGENVIVTDAAATPVDEQALSDAAQSFADAPFARLPSPRVAVLIGGSSRAYEMTGKVTEDLIARLLSLSDKGVSLMVTASRRTGAENMERLRRELTGGRIYFWDGTGENPYRAFLAYADAILVTADSVSMISDALTTGKPAFMIPLEGGSPRFDALHRHLMEIGALRPFEDDIDSYSYTPLNDAGRIAGEILRRMPASKG